MMGDIQEIELLRCEIEVPVWRLEMMAGLSFNHYRALRSGRHQGSAEVLQKLRLALVRLAEGERGKTQDDVVVVKNRELIRLAVGMVCLARGLDAGAVVGHKPAKKATACAVWRQAAELRSEAWALVNNVFGLRGADIARAAGVSRAAVSYALRRVEEKREDVAYDQFFVRLEHAILGM